MRNTKRPTRSELEESLEKTRKQKKTFMWIMIIAIVIAGYLYYSYSVSPFIDPLRDEVSQNSTTETSSSRGEEITYYIQGVVNGILTTDYPFFTQILIALGVIYLIMIGLSVSGDLIKIVLVICVGTYRGARKGINWAKGENKQ